MTFDLVLGTIAIGFGLLTLAARLFGWENLISKRKAMRARFGDGGGETLHIVAYTVLPIVCGGVLVFLASSAR